MKLYNVPNETYIRVKGPYNVPPDGKWPQTNEILFFDHLDGAYSLCRDTQGNPIHLGANCDVEIVPAEELINY